MSVNWNDDAERDARHAVAARAERQAAGAISEAQRIITAARRRDMTDRGMLPHPPVTPTAIRATYPQPLRSNQPLAGGANYEPHSPVPAGRLALALCVLTVCGVVLAGLVWAGLRWRSGIGW